MNLKIVSENVIAEALWRKFRVGKEFRPEL